MHHEIPPEYKEKVERGTQNIIDALDAISNIDKNLAYKFNDIKNKVKK